MGEEGREERGRKGMEEVVGRGGGVLVHGEPRWGEATSRRQGLDRRVWRPEFLCGGNNAETAQHFSKIRLFCCAMAVVPYTPYLMILITSLGPDDTP